MIKYGCTKDRLYASCEPVESVINASAILSAMTGKYHGRISLIQSTVVTTVVIPKFDFMPFSAVLSRIWYLLILQYFNSYCGSYYSYNTIHTVE